MAQKSPLEQFVGIIVDAVATKKPEQKSERVDTTKLVPRGIYDEMKKDRDRVRERYDRLVTTNAGNERELHDLRRALDTARAVKRAEAVRPAGDEPLGYDGMTDPAYAQPDLSRGHHVAQKPTYDDQQAEIQRLTTRCQESGEMIAIYESVASEARTGNGDGVDGKLWYLVGITDGLKVKIRTTNGEETVALLTEWLRWPLFQDAEGA